ncbi:MAG: beta-propeller fold lactonase family protein [Mycobacterium sp.]|nr:beta-propeller fold lactonase family protein [Mycobacterium sp.]
MGNATCIGRVGALAVALGVGSAMVTAPWVAVAEPTTDSSSASASDSSTGASSAGEAASADDSEPATSADVSGGAETPDEDPSGEADGGAGADADEFVADAVDAPEPEAGETADAEPATDPQESSPVPEISALPTDSEVTIRAQRPDDGDAPAPTEPVIVEPTQAADPDEGPAGAAADAHKPAIAVSEAWASSPVPAVPAETTAPTSAAAAPVPAAQAAPVSVVSGLVSGLLAWVGLSPGLTSAPAVPAEAPLLWGLLEWVRREVRRAFVNQTPTTAYHPAENSQSVGGVVTGDLNAVDADGDPLRFTVTQAPLNGTVVVNPDGTFVYTPDPQSAVIGGTDVFTVEVTDQGAHFHGLAGFFTPDSGHSTTAAIAVTVDGTIDVGDGPTSVAVSPDGATIYVANAFGDSLSVIDTASGAVTTIAVGDAPNGVAITPDGSTVLVTNFNDDTVSMVDTATNSVATTIVAGDGPVGVAIMPDGTTAYVANNLDGTVSVLDIATNSVIDTVMVGGGPSYVAIRPDGAVAYVSNVNDDTVSVIDTVTSTIATCLTKFERVAGGGASPILSAWPGRLARCGRQDRHGCEAAGNQ